MKETIEYAIELDLTNNSDEEIRKYKLGMYSEGPVKDLKDFYVSNNGNEVPQGDLEYIAAQRIFTNGNDNLEFDFDLFVPIELAKGSNCVTKIVEKETHGFDKLFTGERDFLSTRTHYVTKELIIKVQLEKEAAKLYSISEHKKGGSKDFEVSDDSKNILTNYQESLRSSSSFKKDKRSIEWRIRDPVIDYYYKLFIELRKNK